MSKPYKRKGKDTWSYDFQWQGRRFSGNTGCTRKADAQKWINVYKTKIKAATTSHRHGEDLTVRDALVRYQHESGQYHKRPHETDRDLGWLLGALTPRRKLSTITNSDVSALVAKRRSEGLSNASVNRYVIERLRAVMIKARDEWDVPVRSLNWKKLALKEPRLRIREMSAAEEDILLSAMEAHTAQLVRFALLSGFRLAEAVNLSWRDIDWHGATIAVLGKGDKPATIPLSRPLRDLLWPMPRTSATVFGISYSGMKSAWRRAMTKSGLQNLRFHDLRHTCATRLLRSGASLAHVQRLLRHDDIATTTRYTHVNDTDLRALMDQAAIQSPTKSHDKPVK